MPSQTNKINLSIDTERQFLHHDFQKGSSFLTKSAVLYHKIHGSCSSPSNLQELEMKSNSSEDKSFVALRLWLVEFNAASLE